MNRRTSKDRYIYICESPVLNGYKIGYHTGDLIKLYRRYQTAFTNKVSFTLFETDHPEKHEQIIHRILTPYQISNELFLRSDDLYTLYCYMVKCVTGCDKAKCYSRDKYDFSRDRNKWQYQKLEDKESELVNKSIDDVLKSGCITINDDEGPGIDNVIENMENLALGIITDDTEDVDEISDKYIDNPFGKWACKRSCVSSIR